MGKECKLLDVDALKREVEDLDRVRKEACSALADYDIAFAEFETARDACRLEVDRVIAECNAKVEAAERAMRDAEQAWLVAEKIREQQTTYICDLVRDVEGVLDPTP
jgi:hypothetical protein